MFFGSKFVYLGNEADDEEEVKLSDTDDVVMSDSSDVSDDDGETCLLDILDTAGQEEYSSLKDLYVQNGDGFVIIYSITCHESFNEAEAIFRWLKRMKPDNCHAILVANKQDLKSEAIISSDDGKELARKLEIPFFETSAKDGSGVVEAMKGLIQIIPRTGDNYKIVMLGSGAVGKSSITIRFVNDIFIEDYDPTIEDSYRKMIKVNGLQATSKDQKKALKKEKKLKKKRGRQNRHDLSFNQSGPVRLQSQTAQHVRQQRPRSAKQPKPGLLRSVYGSLRNAVFRPRSAQVPYQQQQQQPQQQQQQQLQQQQAWDCVPSAPPDSDISNISNVNDNSIFIPTLPTPPPPPPQSQIADSFSSEACVPPPPGPPPKLKKEKKADGNVVLISLRTLEEEPKLVTGDPVRCKQCEVILTEMSQLVASGDKKIWNCEFCGHANQDLDMSEEEIPKGECFDYMLCPATEPVAEEEGAVADYVEMKKKSDAGVIVYCMDISSSMSAGCNVPESQSSWRQERLGVSDTNRVSRLNCIQMAVERLAEQLKDEQPNKQILLVVFSSQVTVKAGVSARTLPEFNSLEKTTFDQLIAKGVRMKDDFTLKPIEESCNEIVQAVQQLRTTGCTALGPALSICLGFVCNIPSSEIVLCTDGEPNVGVGSSSQGNPAAFYEMVGKYARSKNVTINILAVEGSSCDLQSVNNAAEHSGGTTNKLNSAELVRQLRSIAQNELVATSVTVRFFLHPDFVFDEPEYGDNLSQLEKEVGSARKETDLTFRFKVRDPSKKFEFDSVPFQVQIEYTKLNGMKCIRILSKKNQATNSRKNMEENISATVLSVSAMKTTAQLAKKGKGREAQHMIKNVKRMVARGAKTTEQKEAKLAFNNEIEVWDDHLTYNNNQFALAPGQQQSDAASNMIYNTHQMSSNRSEVGASKLNQVMARKKMNLKSKAAYYSYKSNLM